MPIPLLGGIAALFGSGLVKILLDRVLFFAALKSLMVAFFVVVAPVILNNLIHGFMTMSMQMLNSNMQGTQSFESAMAFTGFCAWLLNCFKFPEILSVLISALQVNLLLKMIPFSPVK